MTTQEQIQSPHFTGIWLDSHRFHVKFRGVYCGNWPSRTEAEAFLSRRIARQHKLEELRRTGGK